MDRPSELVFCRVGPVGLEPTTHGLKVRCSAIELEAQAYANNAGKNGRNNSREGNPAQSIGCEGPSRTRPGHPGMARPWLRSVGQHLWQDLRLWVSDPGRSYRSQQPGAVDRPRPLGRSLPPPT